MGFIIITEQKKEEKKPEEEFYFKLEKNVYKDTITLIATNKHGDRISAGSILTITPEGLILEAGVSSHAGIPRDIRGRADIVVR